MTRYKLFRRRLLFAANRTIVRRFPDTTSKVAKMNAAHHAMPSAMERTIIFEPKSTAEVILALDVIFISIRLKKNFVKDGASLLIANGCNVRNKYIVILLRVERSYKKQMGSAICHSSHFNCQLFILRHAGPKWTYINYERILRNLYIAHLFSETAIYYCLNENDS